MFAIQHQPKEKTGFISKEKRNETPKLQCSILKTEVAKQLKKGIKFKENQ